MKSKTFQTLSFLAVTLLFSINTFAHALWIETKATGTKGNAQTIDVYFGEFADKDITKTAEWFSDIKDFSLILISPSKKEIKLTVKALEDKYQAVFTPDEEGVYTIAMHHTVKDTYGTMKLDYNSSATVVVGNATKGNDASFNTNAISVISKNAAEAKVNEVVKVDAFYEGKIATKQKIKVIAPNGWEKELWTNKEGAIEFTPIWSGNYMVEFAYTEKTTGEHNGKKYDEVWKMATYFIAVK
jgi:uncharacterized GH25 family protein